MRPCFILILLLSFLLTSCQPFEMIGPSLLGTISYPVVALKEAFEDNSDDFYEKTIKEKKEKEKEDEALRCEAEGLPLTDEMKEILGKLNIDNCIGCKPLMFPSCEDKTCDCSKVCPNWCARVCPNNYEILKQSRDLAIPFRENNLAVVNTKEDFGVTGVFGGYCNGITLFTKRMTALASFRPNEKPKDSNGKVITDPEKLSEFYEDIIGRINDGEVADIPGFSNIYEFSDNPLVQPLVREGIREAWTKANFYNPFLVESWGVITEINESKFNEEYKNIDNMIQMTGSAQVTMSMNDSSGNGEGHTVEIYHLYEQKKGDEVITMACTNNSNDYRTSNQSKEEWLKKPKDNSPDGVYCPTPLALKKTRNGKTTFKRNIKVDNMDKRTSVHHIEAVRKRCKKDRKCD